MKNNLEDWNNDNENFKLHKNKKWGQKFVSRWKLVSPKNLDTLPLIEPGEKDTNQLKPRLEMMRRGNKVELRNGK